MCLDEGSSCPKEESTWASNVRLVFLYVCVNFNVVTLVCQAWSQAEGAAVGAQQVRNIVPGERVVDSLRSRYNFAISCIIPKKLYNFYMYP